ncbi:MAG: TonB-dependent receptor [Gammaproteobacteria bacterium]|nr:TonB-dependent receptor [Gammaproteobacteria bacterium]
MNQHFIFFRGTTICACLIALVVTSPVVPAPAFAQQIIEEMVVTARKRNENLQDVPAAVAAFNAVELEERGIDNLIEIGRLTPNITVNETTGVVAGALQVYIRGIGYDPGFFEQGVGIYVDDVFLNRVSGSLIEVYDIERIEILKGPQGHLYGRNSTGGTIKYVSAEPDDTLRIHASAKIGTDDQRNFKAGVSGPLAEGTLWGSVAVSQVGHDGYQTNTYNGGEYASPDILSARGTLVAQLGDSFRVKLVADLMRDRSDPYIPTRVAVNDNPLDPTSLFAVQGVLSGANQLPFLFPGAGLLGELLDTRLPTDIDEINSAFIEDGFDEYFLDTDGLSLTATWDFAEAWSLKSVTGVREMSRTQASDFDGSDQQFINTLQYWDTDDFSQEFQINYTGERINAIIGYYYLDSEWSTTSFTEQRAILRFFNDHDKTTSFDERPLESTAFYANVDWDITDKIQLSLGGRLTTDKKWINQIAEVELTQYMVPVFNLPGMGPVPFVLSPAGAQAWPLIAPNLPPGLFLGFFSPPGSGVMFDAYREGITYPENRTGEDEWDEFTPTVKLSYRLSEEMLIYAGRSTGFKSGGLDYTSADPIADTWEPELVTTWSIGTKSTLLDGTLRLNFEAFLNAYEDRQFTSVRLDEGGGGSLIQYLGNVADVESSGVEVEILWLPPVEGLAINFNLGLLDTDLNELIGEVSPGVVGNIADRSQVGHSPKVTAQARIEYTMPISRFGALTFGLDADYRDEMFTDSPVDLSNALEVQSKSEARTLTNAFVSFNTADDRWRVSLEGKNLSDKRVLGNTFTISNFMLGGYNRGRTWGLSVAYQMQ